MLRLLPLAASAALFAMPALACEGFEAHDAYARFSTAMSQSGAAFMTLHNHGSADCQIIGARSEVAARTELHAHAIDANGVARMAEIEDGIALPAGGEHRLERGSDHLMLMGLPQAPEQGAVFGITFLFADGSESVVEVIVDNDRMPGAATEDHSHGTMHGH